MARPTDTAKPRMTIHVTNLKRPRLGIVTVEAEVGVEVLYMPDGDAGELYAKAVGYGAILSRPTDDGKVLRHGSVLYGTDRVAVARAVVEALEAQVEERLEQLRVLQQRLGAAQRALGAADRLEDAVRGRAWRRR